MIDFIRNITFAQPYFLLLLGLLPILAFWYYRQYNRRYPNLRMPGMDTFSVQSLRGQLQWLLPVLRLLGMAFLILALARPQKMLQEEKVKAEGIDIVLVMDLSSSMLAQDFKPNRLEASKVVAEEFVNKRPYDRIGLVEFAGEAFAQSPVTTDHDVIKQYLSQMQVGLLTDGTAIGMGLATAVNRLKESPAKSKVIILLTDGVNNTGFQSPELAAQIAKAIGVKVYTIGIGSTGRALTPVNRNRNGQYIFGLSEVQIDEALLTQIAEETGGHYYRATTAASLSEIYDVINKLEKTEIETTVFKRYSEEFYWLALIGLLIFVLELILRYTLLRTIP